jgi:hypothetical protein
MWRLCGRARMPGNRHTKCSSGVYSVNRLSWILLGLLSFALAASLFFNLRPTASASSPSYLYVQTAGAGEMTPVEGEHGVFDLTLTGVDPKVIYFADRPQRDAGTLTAAGLIEFLFDPSEELPNAVLVVSHSSGADGPVRLPVQLSEPQYDESKATMTYRAELLAEFPENLPHVNGEEPVNEVPPSFTEASLFIDSQSTYSCNIALAPGSHIWLVLGSKDPSADWHWSGVSDSLYGSNSHDTDYIKYYWHSKSEKQVSTLVYEVSRDNPNGGEYEATLTLTLSCKWKFAQGGDRVGTSCTITGRDSDQFSCYKEVGVIKIGDR